MKRKLVAVMAVLAALTIPVASAPASGSSRGNDTSRELTRAVDLLGLTEHLTAFQYIGSVSDGNRVAGREGHDRSARYVYTRLRLAGYKPRYQDFTYTYTGDRTPVVLSVVGGTNYAVPFQVRRPTGLDSADSGDVTAPLIAVDLRIPSTGGSTSGCEAADFAGFPAGSIALLQRGTCDFVIKFQNAINAGAAAIVIMNEGNAPDRMGFNGFNPATTGNIPIVNTTFPVGQELANGEVNGPTGRTARVKIDIVSEQLPTRNVIAETPGRSDNVVVVGAHLDSVEDGPGVNDNGSGSSAILEIAEEMRKVKPKNQVRFMWYSAEESGLLGSEHYVDTLPETERRKIAAMLNFDMLASPNFVRFIYDGDQNAFPPPPVAPPGSGAIEKIFADYFASRGLASAPTAFNGRSDYGPFIAQGIPAGGLFTGAEGIKTAAEQAIFGGAAGEQYDPCYHAFCDTLGTLVGVPPAVAMINPATNRNSMRFNGMRGFDQMADAAAHTTITLARSTAAVNGNGTGNPGPPPAALRGAASHDDETPTDSQ
jgi:Zn-dependent M28 family amino/carboxypeptidase